MRKATQRLFLLLCVFILACAGPMESIAVADTTYTLPWDFSGGMPLKNEYFYGSTTYADPTIAVKIQHGVFDRGAETHCEYWVASIKIAHASQLRTTAANGFRSEMLMKGTAMAKRVNAVLAINGDYWYFTHHGYILRQGQLFLDDLRGDRDVLLIDEDGDFHIVRNPFTGQVHETINGKKVMQAFFFGPVLVENGKMVRDMALREDMAAEERKQRMCIAQVGPLEYKCICCGPPARGNSGMNLTEFARLVYSLGVETAYNLDGGNSTMLMFNGQKINDVNSADTRDIADIIYFASAFGAK
ncbi:MAG: phosphodiester glycosidase family protein [Clostridia bacterium]|jgi:exopolysaccharide biosynthesis protein|nr:phosphodiester glycosidase family protein [Clostridia bacterium]